MFRPQGGEPRIFQRSAGGAANDRFSQRISCFDDADAALQPPPHVKRDENTAPFGENSCWGNLVGNFPVGDGLNYGRAGQQQRGTPICFREEQHPGISCGPRASADAGAS